MAHAGGLVAPNSMGKRARGGAPKLEVTREDLMRNAVISTVFVSLLLPVAARAAGFVTADNTLTLYGLGAFIDGDVTYGEMNNTVDIDASDVVDSLEAAAFARYRHQNERWAFAGSTPDSAIASRRAITTDVNFDLYVFQGDVAYRSESVEALAVSATSVSRGKPTCTSATAGPFTVRATPRSGIRSSGCAPWCRLSERLGLQAQGDIGGGATWTSPGRRCPTSATR
jgi:hypothetical protein